MFGNFFTAFKAEPMPAEAPATRRRHTRRNQDRCVAMINGKLHPVSDWSVGGLQVAADDRLYAVNDEIDITMKFDIGAAEMINVDHKAKVVRKSHGRLGLQFFPLSAEIRKRFQTVVNEFMANEFSDSQEAF